MSLIDAVLKKSYLIQEVLYKENEDLAIRLNHLGFLIGEEIIVHRKTPVTSSSLVVEIKGARIALNKEEARVIKLMEMSY